MSEEQEHNDSPWEQGIYDAHCHPTDIMASIDDIPHMKAKGLTIMATRQQDQELVESVAARFPLDPKLPTEKASTCAVIPAFGWHPWYSYQIYDDRQATQQPDAIEHYKSVLTPETNADDAFFRELPEPKSLTAFLDKTEQRLTRNPCALVGEVGIDRAFRLPKTWLPQDLDAQDSSHTPGSREGRGLSCYRVRLEHQKDILEAQLRLAARLERPVSVHSVQAHGAVYEVLSKLWSGHEIISRRQRKRRESAAGAHLSDQDDCEMSPSLNLSRPFPPRICMHSYSGPVDFLREFLKPSVPVDFYFSFSDVVNFSSSSFEKITGVIHAVPDSKILVESDLHHAGAEMDDRLLSVFQRVCHIKKWSPIEGSVILRRNWHAFVFGI